MVEDSRKSSFFMGLGLETVLMGSWQGLFFVSFWILGILGILFFYRMMSDSLESSFFVGLKVGGCFVGSWQSLVFVSFFFMVW
jgi:hypothetical protein